MIKRKLTNFAIGLVSMIAALFMALYTNTVLASIQGCEKVFFQIAPIWEDSCVLVRNVWLLVLIGVIYFVLIFTGVKLLVRVK